MGLPFEGASRREEIDLTTEENQGLYQSLWGREHSGNEVATHFVFDMAADDIVE